MRLEEKLLPVKDGTKVGYRLIQDGKNFGLIRGPELSNAAAENVTTEELRRRYHEILASLKGNMTGYSITDEGKPIACLFSKEHHLKMFEEAFDILCCNYERRNRQVQKVRSFISRLFNRKTG